jgi:hypothetical protein
MIQLPSHTLSPYTQYYIRKLLRQYAVALNYPLSGIGISAYFQQDLHRILKKLYPSNEQLQDKIQELEMLVQHHQPHDTDNPYLDGNLTEIEQKILRILDLKFLALLPALPLTVVPEAEAALFHFVLESNIQEGIRCAEDLYGRVLTFGAKHNSQIYQFLLTLMAKQVPFVLAVSETRHSLWISLRSPFYNSLLRHHLASKPMRNRIRPGRRLEKIA